MSRKHKNIIPDSDSSSSDGAQTYAGFMKALSRSSDTNLRITDKNSKNSKKKPKNRKSSPSPGTSYGTEPASSKSFNPVEGLRKKYPEQEISKKLAKKQENKPCSSSRNPSSDRIEVSDDINSKPLKKKKKKKKHDLSSLPSEPCTSSGNPSLDRIEASDNTGSEPL